MAELIRYEWDPRTEMAALVYEKQVAGQPVEYHDEFHQPLHVNPADYWDNLKTYLRLTGRKQA